MATEKPEVECGPDGVTWFMVGRWPECVCGYAPKDNAALIQHWADAGFKVHEDHGQLILTLMEVAEEI